MKNKLLLLIFLGISILFNSCKQKQEEFNISAEITGFEDNSKVIVSDRITGKILDSTTIIKNNFTLKGILDNAPTDLSLVITSSADKDNLYSSFFIGNENVKISGDKSNFKDNLKITGSKHNKFKVELDNLLNHLSKERSKKVQKMFSLRNEGKWNDSLHQAYWGKNGTIRQIDAQIFEKRKTFISKNINSDYALSQLVTYKNDFSKEFVNEQISKLNSTFKNTEYVNVINTAINTQQLKINDKFYNFSAENINGNRVSFADFFDKKYVLLEFFSPYCGICLGALPEIKKIAHNNKLDVISLYVDKSKEDWIEHIEKENIDWVSLWIDKGRYSDAYSKYHITGTPTYYLFDKNGVLVKKWVGWYGKEFRTQLNELMK
ncbi:TlpA disulfide reductase family protein [uncultured Psychroserpens sp.]|uniref:TlpA disulfide reductase family protein n=1 Tax=uncultured Psychroserpens sp. TaxID=255436 RepID=UPI0026338EA9|nr:TlpA disulfide reductase family protein [uncultured Psychroserpens sp.]